MGNTILHNMAWLSPVQHHRKLHSPFRAFTLATPNPFLSHIVNIFLCIKAVLVYPLL